MTTVLLTGANRGIGLEYVRQLLAAGDSVVAACRIPDRATELGTLQQRHGEALRIEQLDVASGESIDALAARLAGVAIDVLINNAGYYGAAPWPEGATAQTLDGMDYDQWERTLRINVMGPFRLVARLLPNLLAGERKLVAMISSDLGSIANNSQGQSHAYRSSKAALNMIARGLGVELKAQGVTVIALAPGWTQTDLGGDGAQWLVADSVAAQRRVLGRVTLDDAGAFIDLTGDPLPW